MGIRDYYIRDGNLSYEVDGEHTDRELTKAEMELLHNHLSGIRNSVHFCCGAGRHVSAFASLNIFSVGVDISPYLVARGNRNIRRQKLSGRACLVLGEATAAPIRLQSTDCVTLLGNSFSLFAREDGRILLGEIIRILRSNGILILDMPYTDHVEATLGHGHEISRRIKTKHFGEVNLTWIRRLDAESHTLISQEIYTFTDENECRQVRKLIFGFRLYDPREICSMASDVGLRLIRQTEYNDSSGRYQGMLQRRIFLILRAQA